MTNDPANPTGFIVKGVPSFGATTCVMYNQVPAQPTAVRVSKEWVVNGGPPVAQGSQPAGLNATLNLQAITRRAGQPERIDPVAGVTWGQQVTEHGSSASGGGTVQFMAGDGVIINETVSISAPNCSTGQRATIRGIDPATGQPTSPTLLVPNHEVTLGANPSFNEYTVTNYVTCVTPPTITVTKVAQATDVCAGGSAGYTITVRNNSTSFSWTGSVTDNVLGTIAASVTLAPGQTVTYTPTHVIQAGPVTNTVTATGTFADPAATVASANAQATVRTHACDISITKTALTPAVCTGTTASYSITVRNNSDAFTWTGSVSDDKLGPIATNISLAPGASQTFTKSGTVTGTVTNIATATGSFGTTAANASASATVTVGVCTITVTKFALNPDVCVGGNANYSFAILNNSTAFSWTGSVTDDVLGTIAANLTLGPGKGATVFRSHVMPAGPPITNTVTAAGSFADPAATAASATAQATNAGHACGISVTKAAASAVCNGTTASYTYTVTNNSDRFRWTGSVTDDKLGPIATNVIVEPLQSQDVHRDRPGHWHGHQHRHRHGHPQ